jgi:hypothetical protein
VSSQRLDDARLQTGERCPTVQGTLRAERSNALGSLLRAGFRPYCAERASPSQKDLVSHAALAGAATVVRTDNAIRVDMIVFMSGTPLLVRFACREMIGEAAGCRHRRSFPPMAGIIRELSWAAELPARRRIARVMRRKSCRFGRHIGRSDLIFFDLFIKPAPPLQCRWQLERVKTGEPGCRHPPR